MLEGLPGDEEVEHSSVSWESGGSLPPPPPHQAHLRLFSALSPHIHTTYTLDPAAHRTHPWESLLFVQGALGLQG